MRLTTLQLSTVLALALMSIAATRPGAPDAGTPSADASPAESIASSPAPIEPPAVQPFHPSPVTLGDSDGYAPPDFTHFVDVGEKKRAFYDYLLPMVHDANREVMRERAWLKSIAQAIVEGAAPSTEEIAELEKIERRYAVRQPAGTVVARVSELMRRVDVVPASLVIAQAAKESGWGTSRFAREGNNFFGIWCFYEGCGMLPLSREAGRNHEVARFETVEEGVRYYIRTINTHVAYTELREMRANARIRNERIGGQTLANGLIRYSERGLAYVREIQSMIRYNELHRFNRPYSV